MVAIRETLILEDKFTSTMTQCLQVAQRVVDMLDDVRVSMINMEAVTVVITIQMQEFTGKMTQTNSRGTSLLGTIRNLADTFLDMQSVRWLVDTSNQLTSINARLRLMTGSVEAVAAAQEGIYQAVIRNRRAYADMTDFVSQLGMVAGNAFTGTNELVAFAEQIQRQMAIFGTSSASARAALMQPTQDLASGILRGEELDSMLEQTPMIAQTIAKYMDAIIGEIWGLTSEGKVAAEVVKNVMPETAEKTSAQLEQMPVIQAWVWTMFQNVTIQAFDPVLDATSWLVNNVDLVGPIILELDAAFGVFLLATNWTSICTAATTALTTTQEMLGVVTTTIWGSPLIIIALVIGAIYAVTAVVNHFVRISVSAIGIIAGAVLTVTTIIENTIIGLLSGIIQAAWSIFVTPFLRAIEWVLNVTNGGFDSFGRAVANLIGNVISWFLDLGKVMTKIIGAIFGINWTAGLASLQDSVLKWGRNENAITLDGNASTIDYRLNYGDAWNTDYNWGANLFSGNGNDTIGAAPSGVSYDELSGQLGDIAKSIRSIEKLAKMSDEDIKPLADVAERRYVNNVNLTAQTPMIAANGADTGRITADRQNLANAIRDIPIEQTASGSTHGMAWPIGG